MRLFSIHFYKKNIRLDYLIDSMPIMLANGSRSKTARVACQIAATGFSAVKQTNFHGVQLHLVAEKQTGSLPGVSKVWLTPGNVHDTGGAASKH